uniref:AMP-binding protein n=1 Tax=Kocuria sp. TaxID=1871328 RepID=UPI0025BA7F7B
MTDPAPQTPVLPAGDGAPTVHGAPADRAASFHDGAPADHAASADDGAPSEASANTVGALVQRAVARNGGATALLFEDRRWSYRELGDAVRRVSRRLVDAGLSPGSRVAAFGVNSDVYAILYLACAQAGLVHVPVNFALKGDELAYVLEDSGATTVIADPELLPLVA